MIERTLVLWWPRWPIVAATRADPTLDRVADPVVVVQAEVVVAVSPVAAAAGVVEGQRRRTAQQRCPGVRVVAADPALDARAFEPVAAAVAELCPRVEVLAPGTVALATRGPSRYFGGDQALATRLRQVAGAVGSVDSPEGPTDGPRVGIADGLFTALVAARAGAVVPAGAAARFLAPLPIASLALDPALGDQRGRPLADVLGRLGLRTLGDLAALDPADVVGRFGIDGVRAHRLAQGLGGASVVARTPPVDLVVQAELDPPAEQVEAVAFLARALAVELDDRLAASGLACTRVSIEAETEHGESRARLWRHEGALDPTALAERTRWQLDGWLRGDSTAAPTGGITMVRLVPDEVVADHGRQLGFWGERSAADQRAARAVARAQGLLGPDAVLVPRRRGGRAPGEQVVLVPAADELEPGSSPTPGPRRRAPATSGSGSPAPWPGQVPRPAPAAVHAGVVRVEVVDDRGEAVTVSGRGEISGPPARVSVAGGAWAEVRGWAGPWPAYERWWDPPQRRRVARIQVLTDDAARLLLVEGGRWRVEATYD